MKEELYSSIKVGAYFLWEYLRSDNALSLWHCAEDIANVFQVNGIDSLDKLESITNKEKTESAYIDFVRTLSYRIYYYTGYKDSVNNWYFTERLLQNSEWCSAIITAANIYSNIDTEIELIKIIRSDVIRNFYMNRNK